MTRPLLLVTLLLLLATPGAQASGRPGFGWPLPGVPRVERGFEPPSSPYGAGHRGVDLSATWGSAVLAAGPGRVTYAGLLAGRGVVTVTHAGGLRTTYEPVDPSAHVGDLVVHGSVLGRLSIGHASCRRRVCLHWGLLRGQVYLDPLSLIDTGPMRLLPVGSAALSGAARTVPRRGSAPPLEPAPAPGPGQQRRGAPVSPALLAVIGGAALLGGTALRRQDARRHTPP